MITHKTYQNFLKAIIALWVIFFFGDASGFYPSTLLKFISILFVAYFGKYSNDKNITLSLILTAFAELFILFIPSLYVVAIIILIIVQYLYCIKVTKLQRRRLSFAFTMRTIFAFLIFKFAYPQDGFSQALVLAYFVLFSMNLFVCSFKASGYFHIMLYLGLFLVYLSNICVGVHYFADLVDYYDLATKLQWFLFIPGQVMILLSTLPRFKSNE